MNKFFEGFFSVFNNYDLGFLTGVIAFSVIITLIGYLFVGLIYLVVTLATRR